MQCFSYLLDSSLNNTVQPLKVDLQRWLFDEHLFQLSHNYDKKYSILHSIIMLGYIIAGMAMHHHAGILNKTKYTSGTGHISCLHALTFSEEWHGKVWEVLSIASGLRNHCLNIHCSPIIDNCCHYLTVAKYCTRILQEYWESGSYMHRSHCFSWE